MIFGEFDAKYGKPQCFGWINGTQISISSHSENSQDYFCYKQFHSLNNQAERDFGGFFIG